MRYTLDDLRRMREAADHLKRAANLLYLVGGPDCVALGEQIEPVLESEEAGLLPFIRILESRASVFYVQP